MFATAATHLAPPCAHVADVVLAGDPSRWLPELERLDDRRLDELGARSSLDLPGGRAQLTTTRVRRTTVTLTGRAQDGRDVCLRLSVSPWDGHTVVVVSVEVGDAADRLVSWRLTRRLELALLRLAGACADVVPSR